METAYIKATSKGKDISLEMDGSGGTLLNMAIQVLAEICGNNVTSLDRIGLLAAQVSAKVSAQAFNVAAKKMG